MVRAMSRVVMIAALVSGLGCGSSVRLTDHLVLEPVRELAEDHPIVPAAQRVATPLRVFVLEPLQGLHMRNSSEDARVYETYALPAPPRPQMTPEELEIFYTGFYDQMHETHGTNMAVRFPDYALAMQESLQRHLSAYFANVVVERVPIGQTPPPGGFVVEASGGVQWKMTKTADLALATQGPIPLAPVEGHGRRRTGPHLAWAVPLMLALGLVLGIAIVNPALGAVSRGHMVASIAVAIDDAARQWAAQIAATSRR